MRRLLRLRKMNCSFYLCTSSFSAECGEELIARCLNKRVGNAKENTQGRQSIFISLVSRWLRGAMVARLTPDQKAACSSHVVVNILFTLGFYAIQAILLLLTGR